MSYDPTHTPDITHGNTRRAKDAKGTIEELRNQVHDLQHRIAKCSCGVIGPAEPPEPEQPFDEMEAVV